MSRLDERLLPGRRPGKYDAPRPTWFTYAPITATVLGVLAVWAQQIFAGWLGIVVCLTTAALWLLVAIVTIRWDRIHRVGRPTVF
jgi:hypothetical protein